MKSRTGTLPLVTPAYENEILGSWLIRVASTYDLSLPSFLTRIGAAREDRRRKQLLWLELDDANTDWEVLAQAVSRRASDLRKMNIVKRSRFIPKEIVLCKACLLQSIREIGSPVWKKDWLHPFAAVCASHHCWLAPIPYLWVRSIRRSERIAEFAHALPDRQIDALGESANLIVGARWIHQAFIAMSSPPVLQRDLADLDSVPLVHKLVAALTRDVERQGSPEHDSYRQRMRHIGLIGLFLKSNSEERQTNTPAVFTTAIDEHRKAVAEWKYILGLIAPLYASRPLNCR